MPRLEYSGKLPTPKEFQADIERALAESNPLDDLVWLSRELLEFEQKYGMSSEEFSKQYEAGLLDDELQHCMEWAAIYDMFLKTKRQLEVTLMRAAVFMQPAES